MADNEAKKKENYDDEEDETLSERLWGLTEMFPCFVRTSTTKLVGFTTMSSKKVYKFTRAALWASTSCFVMLAIPVVFEQERFNLEQQQQQHQRQILLGPNAAVASTPNMGVAPMPPAVK